MALLTALALAVVAFGTPVSAQDYETQLSAHLVEASEFLDDAGQAIDECTRTLIGCLSDPDDIVTRIDAASQGLLEVVGNVSAMEVSEENAADHALLVQGFGLVTDGFALYTDGLRSKDPGTLGLAGDLIADGNNQIRAAVNAIFTQPASGTDIVQILTYAVIGATVGLSVLLYLLLRMERRQRRTHIEKEFATCPECGEVLDEWWTYRSRQIRRWLETHLLSHERETSE
ncbi:MAG: hypothetical protein V3W28_08995 [Thermoplasmata archaeon]